ncbi:MAG: glycosyltransferase family 39 protein [Terriglobales bacterium]|jgi:4-amino-4-deoxy-L-arabinose transferase-like glycosyltransferase
MDLSRERKLSDYFIFATVVSCIAQLSWFASKCFTQIDYDGMSYVGIARHLSQGQFHAAINAFRSPLISWIIAAGSVLDGNLLQVGKFTNIGSFLASAVLVYLLTKRLWQSRLAAAIASLWFSLARGLAATAVILIIPDFLLTALVLTYFLILLRCFRTDQAKDWAFLGLVHGVAYLAKAFALPWLALATLVSVAISFRKQPRHGLNRFVLASLAPLLIAAAWATALHSKYGVFTTGSQFRSNFLGYNVRSYSQREPTYALLNDTILEPGLSDPSPWKSDEYVVNDPMPPHSRAWSYRPPISEAVPLVIAAERRNLPEALKELTILLTPGGILGFFFMLGTTIRRRWQSVPEFRFTCVVAVSAVSLILAYGMLAFITTYAYPLVALIMAVTSRFFVSDAQFAANPVWQRLCIVLVVAGLIVAFTYRASPFRTLDRNFQMSCYDAAQKLEAYSGSRVVTIGSGPYPEHGVGWEAGYRVAFFSNRRIVAESPDLPADVALLMADIEKSSADAVLLWGNPTDPRFQLVLRGLAAEYQVRLPIMDPVLGQVGVVVVGRIPTIRPS